MKKIGIYLIMCLYLGVGGLQAQEERSEIYVDFRVNSTFIDPDYGDNADRLAEITTFLQELQNDSTVNILSVSFCGTASPEGSYQLNKRLARGRLEALEKLVRDRVEVSDSLIARDDEYIPWNYLASMVQESDLSHKAEVLEILSADSEIVDYHSGQQIDSRILRLQKLDGGKVWQELNRRFFSRMRNACVVFVTFRKELPPVVMPEPVVAGEAPEDTVPTPVPMPEPVAEDWYRKLHIKTNAVGVGLLIANAGVEVDLFRHWSFNLPVYYSSWDYFTTTIKFRTFAVQPEVRYWFDEDNDGWFAGAHFTMAYYNIATGGEYRTQDHDRQTPALGGGIAAGYRLPISRNNRWKMELSLGGGVYKLHYNRFRNSHNGLLVSERKRTYIGIDQVNVSFSYTIDLKKKGGCR